jgi:putative hydrolase
MAARRGARPSIGWHLVAAVPDLSTERDAFASAVTTELNREIAERLDEMAELLEQQDANPFRVSAYRRAAATIAALEADLGELAESEGMAGLVDLPTIGKGIAAAIWEIVHTGRWSQLERLRGSLRPESLLQTVPGIGPALARRIHDDLHVDTLEQLEVAAWDGRLAGLEGIGGRKLLAIRAALSTMLGRGRRATGPDRRRAPPVSLLLSVDQKYREEAEAGRLPTIAPRRFNPGGESWLPILHADMGGWHFTALYSNTARAHELDRVRDWVVIYFYDEHHEEGQSTVVTETRGALSGRRVVRGREADCRAYYANSE